LTFGHASSASSSFHLQPGQTRKVRHKLQPMTLMRLRNYAVRFGVAPALVIWMAGIGCIFGCERATGNESTSSSSGYSTSPDSCPAHRSHDCCAGKSEAIRLTAPTGLTSIFLSGPEGSSNYIGNCPMALNSTAAISKVRTVDPALEQNPLTFHSTILLKRTVADKALSSIRNRGGTYLLCCAFLI